MANVSSSNGLEKRPKLRFPGFDEPWKKCEFKEFAKVNPKCQSIPEQFYYIDLGSVEDGELSNAKIENALSAPSRAQRLLSCNDVLFQTVRPYQQNNYLFCKERSLPTVASTGYAVFRTKYDVPFLYALIHTGHFLNSVLSRCTGTSFPAVSASDIEEILVSIPSLGEQQKIGELFRLLNSKIRKQKALIESLKKYKRGLLHDVLSEKTKITTETWTEHRIGEFLHSKSIKQLPTTDAPLMAFTATGGVCDKGERYDRGFLVKDASTKLYKRTDLNDFIYSSNNLDVGSIGLNLYGSAVISDVYEIFSIKDADPWFISEAIKQKPIMSRILKYRQGCLYGQYRIYAEDFLGVFVKIPSYEAQKKIGAVFSKIDGKITQEQILLDCLEKARNFFLQQLFI